MSVCANIHLSDEGPGRCMHFTECPQSFPPGKFSESVFHNKFHKNLFITSLLPLRVLPIFKTGGGIGMAGVAISITVLPYFSVVIKASSPLADKVSMLTHIYPHKPGGRLK